MIFRPFIGICFSVLLLFSLAPASANEVVLTAWHNFSSGYGDYQNSTSAKSADVRLPDVSGELWGAKGARDTWGSNDGTYGASVAVGNSDVNGAMTMRTDRNFVEFSIVNNSPGSLELSRILFDFASINTNSPKNLKLYYFEGDLDVADNTLIEAWENIHNGLAVVSDYEDVDVSLAGLADRTLAAGQTAKFRFLVDTASNATQAMLLDNLAIMGASSEFRVLTYNIHGGKGPAGEGDLTSNITAFRDTIMKGEDVLCLQEVGAGNASNTTADWNTVKSLFPEYPYTYQTKNKQTRYWWSSGVTSIAILSKYPFESTHSQLIQIDPQGDKWERHAQHVQIKVGGKLVDIFNFHNTYNFNDNDWESEKAGMVKFRSYVLDRLDIATTDDAGRLLMMGDFNVLQANVIATLPTPSRVSYGRDHISANPLFSNSGNYNTVTPDLSDHRAIWASLDLAAPTPYIPLWAVPPAEAGTTAIMMSVANASDPNGVEYLFTNQTLSRNSGWQSSPTFTDTGLSPATTYAYKVRARDKSANQNITELSEVISATTDDGDDLPNDWEMQYFGNLTSSSGAETDDWDQDGSSDYVEWVAGTDPTDKASQFHAWLEKHETTGVPVIKWPSVSGRTYRVLASATMNSDWIEVASGLTPSGANGSFDIDTSEGGKRFYRVEVSQ